MSTKRKAILVVVVWAAAGVAFGMLARQMSPQAVEAASGYHQADTQTARAIGERVTEYWKARTRQDLYGAYPFYEPKFRSTYQPEAFVKTFQRLNRFSPELVSVNDITVDVSGTRAKVSVQLRSKPLIDKQELQELITTQEDVWILENGTWWRQAEAMTPTI
jgi:hypothetical protein